MTKDGGTDELVEESERLRREMLRMAARLEVFSGELIDEAQQLRTEAAAQIREGCDHERGRPGEEPGPERPDGPADQHGHPIDG